MSKHHILKLNPEFIEPIIKGEKTFEIRENNRGFQKGDTVHFIPSNVLETFELNGEYIHKSPTYTIDYVLSGWGIELGYVCFSIRELK